MGEIDKFDRENLIIGVLSSGPDFKEDLEAELTRNFGEIDHASNLIDFNYTSYYNDEMGQNIKRWFYSFKMLVTPEELPEIKIRTNKLEEIWTENGKRQVNLDPGLLDLNRLVLATTKNAGHRIPLNSGIYAEVTLIYMKKNYHPLFWTYPDYQSPEYIEILKKIRELYRQKLKQQK